MSWPAALVSRIAVPPLFATIQMLPSATKTMFGPNG
jgi:hypothetical protein